MEGTNTPQQIESNVSLENLLSPSTAPIQQPVVAPVEPVNGQEPATPPAQNTPTITPNGNLAETLEIPTVIQELQATDLDAEGQAFRTEIFSLFKGEKLNEKGDLLNAKGEVVVSATNLEKYITDQDLTLDAEGNAVNALGEVILTKDKVNEQTSTVVDSIKSSIETNFGISLPKELELTDDVNGITKLVETAVAVQNQNTIKNFLDSDPEIKAFYHHIKLGGTADTYQSSNINYKSIDVKKLDDTSKIDLLSKMFKLQGNPNTEAMLDLIKKGGEEILNQNTAGAIKFLDDKQTERNKNNEVALQQRYQQQIEADTKYWNDVKNVVNTGKLNQLEIPIKDREAFFNYMAVPVDKYGNSADSLAAEQDPIEMELLVSYLRYKKGDLSELVKNIAKTQEVKKLTELMHKHKGRNESGVPRTSSAKPTGSVITLETLLG